MVLYRDGIIGQHTGRDRDRVISEELKSQSFLTVCEFALTVYTKILHLYCPIGKSHVHNNCLHLIQNLPSAKLYPLLPLTFTFH